MAKTKTSELRDMPATPLARLVQVKRPTDVLLP